jgi:hypothetical protein
MRRLVALGTIALAGALTTAFAVAGGGHAAPKPDLAESAQKTEAVASERYTIHVRLMRAGTPLSLHVHGQASERTISVKLQMGSLTLSDGTVVPGPNGAALLDGPFLYERAPSNVAVQGSIHWLRLSVAKLAPNSEDLSALHSMTPRPLLRLLRQANVARAGDSSLFHGAIPYDAPALRPLSKLTAGLEFRHLRVSAFVGRDGLVHRVVLTGRTADGHTTLSIRMRLYAFGRPVHVTPPAPGTFMDQELAQIPA